MVPELHTRRVLLQEIQAEDQPFVFEGLSHPEVIPFYGVRYCSLEETAAQMQWYRKMVDEGSGIPWKMVHKATGEKMGVICVYYYKQEHNRAEIGFWLLPQFWNKGYASEALAAVVQFWKEERGLHRLEGFVEEGNTASSRLLQKAGFQLEGIMRDCEIKNGRYISLQIYAMIME